MYSFNISDHSSGRSLSSNDLNCMPFSESKYHTSNSANFISRWFDKSTMILK